MASTQLPSFLDGYREFFSFVEEKEEKFIFKCKMGCSVSKQYVCGKTSAYNLKLHMQRKHLLLMKKLEDRQEQKRKRDASPDQPSIAKAMKSSSNSKLSKSQVDTAVMEFLINENLPFNLLESNNFQEFVSTLTGEPQRLICLRTANDILLAQLKQLKDQMIEKLEGVNYVCVTADCWTSHHRSFLGVTCHYMTDTYERKSLALACRRIKGAHTYDVLGKELQSILAEFRIHNKVLRVITDNGSNFVKAFRIFSQVCPVESETDAETQYENSITSVGIFDDDSVSSSVILPPHQRCAAHTLNLVASRDTDKAMEDAAFKTASRSMFAKASALWNKQSRTVVAAENIKEFAGRQLVVPNATRWNSTFDAVQCLANLPAEILDKICDSIGLTRFSDRDQLFMHEFIKVMQPLARSLDYLQGDKCVGLGSLLPQLETITARTELAKTSLKICKPLANAVVQGVARRFQDSFADRECLLATVSDPRRKLSWTSNVTLREQARGLLIAECEQTSTAPVLCPQDDEDFFVFEQNQPTSEVQSFLSEPVQPTLHALASLPKIKSVFIKTNTTLPSSAAVERLFSCAGLILTPNRSSVTDNNFEAKVLLKFSHSKL